MDGHHGKITKDDIVGIVYTIYESIGKSVVVPHSGSKTINVRLTVSPDDKLVKPSKAAKKVTPNSAVKAVNANVSGRRLHRYRQRKTLKSDDEDDESNSDKERETNGPAMNINGHNLIASKTSRKIKGDQHCCLLPPQGGVDINIHDSIYDQMKKETTDTCGECLAAVEESQNASISPTQNDHSTASHLYNNTKTVANEAYLKHATSTRIKLLRKSRKQKVHYQNTILLNVSIWSLQKIVLLLLLY